MHGIFYGTGDASGIPNPFCKCEICENARIKGGKEVRKRSMFKIDKKILIDFGPDIGPASQLYGDLADLKHILITHTHHDHLLSFNLMELMWAANRQENLPQINIYLVDKAYNIVECWRQSDFINKGLTLQLEQRGIYKFHKLEYYKKYNIDNCTVIPLKGNHIGNVGELSANYLIILPDKKILYYGLDSYLYFKETYDYLKDYKLDYFITEATGIGINSICDKKNHLNLPELLQVFGRLYSQRTLNDATQVYLSHISHCVNNDEKSILNIIKQCNFPYKVTLAYDGLKINL